MAQANRAFKNGICLITNINGRLWEGIAKLKVGAGSESGRHQFKRDNIAFFNNFKYFDGFLSNFRADTVTG